MSTYTAQLQWPVIHFIDGFKLLNEILTEKAFCFMVS